MFSITIPPSWKRNFQAMRMDLRTTQAEPLNAIGVQVLSLSQQAYLVKSKGGRGSDGIQWAPLKPSTIAKRNRRGKANTNRKTTKSGKARPVGGRVDIGRDAGLQLASASPGAAGNIFDIEGASITVGYGRSYSRYFAEKRPLLPDVLPAAWRKKCDDIVLRWGQSIINSYTN